MRKRKIGLLAALLSLVYWNSRCAGMNALLPVAAVLLAVFGILFAQLMFRSRKAKEQPEPVEKL